MPLAPLQLGAPFGLRLGLKKGSTPRSNNNGYSSGRSTGRATKRAKENPCGHLEPGESCEIRPRLAGEMYGSEIFFIKRAGQADPSKVRKLGRDDQTRTMIAIEGLRYKDLQGKPGFERYCLPYLKDVREGSAHYIDFRYVKGEPLHIYVHKGLSVEKRMDILKQCIRCLKFLANNGYVHGDVKLDNFWWDSEHSRVLVLDFEKATKNPPVGHMESKRSIEYELKKVFKLMELEAELNLRGHVAEILGEPKEAVVKRILAAETSEEGMRRLIGLYRQILGEGGGAGSPRGGARLTRRKNRRSN